MSAAFYNRMASTATRLLTKYGADVTAQRTTGATLDPVAGTYSGGTTSTVTAKGIMADYRTEMIDGTVIQQGDRMIIINDGFTPAIDEQVTINGTTWQTINIETKQPTSVDIVHILQVRK